MMFDGVTDTAMLFVRCGNGGVSHSPREIITAEDADVAARVILDTVLRLGGNIMTLDQNHRRIRRSRVCARDRIPRRAGEGAERQSARRLRARMRAARGSCWSSSASTVEAHDVPRSVVEAAGMKSVTNLIVRHRFGDGPVIALNAHGDVVPPGLGWRLDPYGAVVEDGPHGPVMYGRGVAVSKSDFATYTWTLLALKAAAAQATSCGGTLELHFTYDEEVGGDRRPEMAARREADQARCGDRGRVLLRHRHRARRLPASRGDGHRQAGARRHAGDRRRRAGGGHRHSRRALCASRRR